MKILLLNLNAISGSTGKIVTDIKSVLDKKGHQCIVAYGNGETVNEENYFRYCNRTEQLVNNAISRFTGVPYGDYGFFSTKKLLKFIKEQKPDIVHVHCPNGCTADLYKVLAHLGRFKQKTVVTNHAEFWYTANCPHAFDCNKWLNGCGNCPSNTYINRFFKDSTSKSWRKMKTAFESFDTNDLIVTSVSSWVKERSQRSPFLRRFSHRTVENGLNTETFRPLDTIRDLKSEGGNIVFHATAHFSDSLSDIKGGRYVIELAKKMPDLLFVVACLSSQFDANDFPANLKIWGSTTSQKELSQLYSSAKCTLLTSRRETFSMTTAESLCCGTPVVGFYAGGPETIAIPAFSKFVPYSDTELLANAVRNVIERDYERSEISREAVTRYSKERMVNDYLKIYRELLNV